MTNANPPVLEPAQKTNPAVKFEPVQVREGVIGGIKCQVVDGRELWEKLGVGRDFTHWMKDRLNQYDFELGIDYEVFEFDSPNLTNQKDSVKDERDSNSNNSKGGDRRSKTYRLTINTSKELAMIERTPAGKQVRSYFIDCERQLINDMLARQAAAAQSQQPIRAQRGGELSDDAMDSADVKVLCKLVRAKEARSWLLAMRQYGANLMLSHDEKSSEAIAITIQARVAKQITKRVQRLEDAVFDEPEFSRTIEMIAQWTPSDD